MPTRPTPTLRYFLTYRGVTLPLCLTEELAPDALRNRNTYFQADHDEAGRMLWLEKMVMRNPSPKSMAARGSIAAIPNSMNF